MVISVIDFFIFLIIIAVISFLFYTSVTFKINNDRLKILTTQKDIDLSILRGELIDSKLNTTESIVKDDLISFLSTSKDEAYLYIDQIQLLLWDLKEAVESNNTDRVYSICKTLLSYLPEDR